MQADFWGEVDWSRPWLLPYRELAAPIVQAGDWRAALNCAARDAGLRNHRDLPIRFVPQAFLPAGQAYESFISETGGVPTRDNLHDFFNALVWLRFPLIKRQLNAVQAAEIERAGGAQLRGRVRDAATLFDENAALVATSDPSWAAALREHRWTETLQRSKDRFERSVDVCLFGHALMEKLVAPYKAITAHAWVVLVEPEYFDMAAPDRWRHLDQPISAQLQAGLTPIDFTPLPVAGVPGWWPRQDAGFYADTAVFRLKRAKSDKSVS